MPQKTLALRESRFQMSAREHPYASPAQGWSDLNVVTLAQDDGKYTCLRLCLSQVTLHPGQALQVGGASQPQQAGRRPRVDPSELSCNLPGRQVQTAH